MKKLVLTAAFGATIGLGAPSVQATECTHPGPPPTIHPPDCAGFVEPVTCEATKALAPGVPGVVDINGEGDVWVAGAPLLDCRPYGSRVG